MTLSLAPRRLVTATSVFAAALLLAACTSATQIVRPTDDPTPTAESGVDGAVSDDLTFAAGADLEPGAWIAQWGDPFIGDDSFTVSAPDDGQGNWSYVEVATQCEISFSQGTLGGQQTTTGDAAISDELLSLYLGGTIEEVAPHAYDEQLPQGLGGEGTVQVRSVNGQDPESGVSWIVSARAFESIDGRVLVSVACPSGTDAVAQHDALRDAYLQVVLVPNL